MATKNINVPNKLERTLITKFLQSINEKNYSVANKYLKKIVDSKVNKRVGETINNF
jgi:hypothetical protein